MCNKCSKSCKNEQNCQKLHKNLHTWRIFFHLCLTTAQVGAILTTYLLCTLPAALVLAIDPRADRMPQVRRPSCHSRYQPHITLQAHVPTYVLSWLVAVINPLLYVICNQTYRNSMVHRMRTSSGRFLQNR